MSSESHQGVALLWFVLGFVAGFIAFGLLISWFGLTPRNLREQAIEAGKAEYYLDDKHERQWRWKP